VTGQAWRGANLAVLLCYPKVYAKKRASKVPSDIDTFSDSDVSAAVEARRKKERELKRKVTAAEEETEALEHQLADAKEEEKAKLDQLAAVRNSYPVT
jgi:hypothetical protein